MSDNNNFKVGCKVICIDDLNTRMITAGERYTIVAIEDGHVSKGKYLVFKELEQFNGLNGQRRYRFGSRRFILDIKETRKQKIKEICSINQATNQYVL